VPAGDDYETVALLSAGDTVPVTGSPSDDYQMVGIPDGLGAYKRGDGNVVLHMNHEFTLSTQSAPYPGAPMHRGTLVSQLILDDEGNVLSGKRAWDTVYQENTFVGPAADTSNATRAFGRFCSGSLSGSESGLDRPIYFTNEEVDGANGFDPAGGQSVAIFDGEAHALPKLGRFSKENTLVMPDTGPLTVVMSMEDGPASPDSQLYMYVGLKYHTPGASALRRNGLDNGKLYVFAGNNPSKNAELDLQDGTTSGRWVEIQNAAGMTDAQLEVAADAAGAFAFVRIEDGAFSKTSNKDFFFVTTGGNKAAGNELGRLYHLKLNGGDPTGTAVLRVVYNADQVIAEGGDIAISPDNIDTSDRYLMIDEDGTPQSRLVMQALGREGGIWRFDLNGGGSKVDADSAKFVAELAPPGADGIPVPVPGTWESSGIIDASAFFGEDTWLVDVQAHSPTTAPVTGTVEDGQLLLLRPAD
jgi:hypothetical protein